MSAPEREHIVTKQHTHHTFHLPNGYPRSTLESSNEYAAVPGEEADVVEGASNDNDDDVTIVVGVGVETTPAWHSMSGFQHTLVRIAFGILGATVLLPFNALITPSEYYRSVLSGTARESSFMSWFIAVYNISCIVFGAHATASMPRASIGRRILLSEILILGVLLLTTVLVSTSGSDRGLQSPASNSPFPLMIGLTLVLAAATSYLQLAVVTLANAYGSSCMGTMLSGQGFVGATISLVQLIAALSSNTRSKQASKENSRAHRAAIEFFTATTALMIIGMTVFIILQRSQVYKDMKIRINREKRNNMTLNDEATNERGDSVSQLQENQLRPITGIKRYMGVELQRQTTLVLSTQKKVLVASISISYIFIITLALFPALTARVQSTGNTISPIVFVALHFFIFNLGDLIGRSFPSVFPRIFLIRKMKLIALFCFLRTAFIPIVEYCNISSSSTSSLITNNISQNTLFGDGLFFILMLTFGISNGVLATSIFVTGPHQENLTSPSEQALAAGLLTWWLSIGLAVGSLLSFAVAPNAS